MGISGTLNVKAEVEGEYTLLELLELLGSPKSLAESLKKLEAASKKHSSALKKLESLEKKRLAEAAAHLQQIEKDDARLDRKLKSAESKKRELDAQERELLDRQTKIEAANVAQEKDFKARMADLEEREEAVKRAEDNIGLERKRALDELATLKTSAEAEHSKALALQSEAVAAHKRADERIEDLKKVIG